MTFFFFYNSNFRVEGHNPRLKAGEGGDNRMRWLNGITDSDVSLSKLQVAGDGWGRLAAVLQSMGSQRVGHN